MYKNIDSKLKTVMLFVLIVTIWALLSTLFLSVSIKDSLMWFFICVFFTFIPGFAIVTWLFEKRNIDLDIFLFTSACYIAGYAFDIIFYLVIKSLFVQTTYLIFLFFCLTSLVSIIYVTITRKTIVLDSVSGKYRNIRVLLLVFYSILSFVGYSAFYYLPSKGIQTFVFHPDTVYWVENAASIVIYGIKPMELRMSGVSLDYHWFASAFLAFQAETTCGVDLYSLAYALYGPTKIFVVFGGISLSLFLWFKKRNTVFVDERIILGIILLLFCTGIEEISIATYYHHIFLRPFGLDISIAFGSLFILLLLKQYIIHEFSYKLCICTIISFLMCAGHKAPIAMIYLFLVFLVSCHWLKNKEYKKSFLYGFGILFSFIFVMAICINFLNTNESRVDGGHFSLLASVSPLFKRFSLFETEDLLSIKGIIKYLIVSSAVFLSIHPFIIIAFFASIFSIKKDIFNTSLIFTVLFGLFMGFFNSTNASSQMHYWFAILFPSCVLGIEYSYERFFKLSRLIKTIAIILIIFQMRTFCLYSYDHNGALINSRQGLDRVIVNLRKDSAFDSEYIVDSIQQSDLIAMKWIRDNLDLNITIVADRAIVCDLNKYMLYGTFSQRQMYLEGDIYLYETYEKERKNRKEEINKLFTNDFSVVAKLKNNGVTHIIQTKWITPNFDPSNVCRLLYENKSIKIWELL